MMPVAEMGYTQVLPVASARYHSTCRFAIICTVRHVGLKRSRSSNHVHVQLLASEGSLPITCGSRLLASNRSQLSPITSPSPSRPALESVGTLDRNSCWWIFVLSLPSGLVAWSNVSIHLLALNLVRQPRPTVSAVVMNLPVR